MTSRSRSSGSLTSQIHTQPWFSSDKVACAGSLVRTNRGNVQYVDYVGNSRTMTDEIVPSFKRRVASGEVFFNRMTANEVTLNPAILGGPTVFTGNGFQCSGANRYQSVYEFGTAYPLDGHGALFQPVAGTWSPSPLLSNGEIENAIDEASTRCHSVRGDPPVDFWESIAERKQSYAMLASYLDTSKQIANGLYADVNSNRQSPFRSFVRGTSKVTAGAAGAWLISRYGLLPLLKDIQALRKQIEAKRDEAERHTARGKAVVERFVNTPFSVTQGGGHIVKNGNVLYTDVLDVRATSLDEWKLSLADHFGLSPRGLVTLPYELLTLSFVADWYVNIGEWLKALVPRPAVNQLGSCISYTRTRSITCNVTGYTGAGIAVVSSSGSMSKTGVRVEKVRFPGLRAPTLVVLNRNRNDPVLEKNHLRAVDTAALVGQRLAKVSSILLAKFPLK